MIAGLQCDSTDQGLALPCGYEVQEMLTYVLVRQAASAQQRGNGIVVVGAR